MPLYQAATRTTITTAGAGSVLFAFRGDTMNQARVREIHLYAISAAGSSGGAIGLVRSTTAGSGTITGVTGRARNPGDAMMTDAQVVTGWTTLPTTEGVAATLQRWDHTAAIGDWTILTYRPTEPIVVGLGGAADGELVFINLQSGTNTVARAATYDFTVIWEC